MARASQSLSSPSSLPVSSVVPSRRPTTGSLLSLAIWSTLAWVTPYSSASIRPNTTQRTMAAHSSSPRRTAGPSGSLEISSGRMTWSAGDLASLLRIEARPEASVV
jgi:hypothetical protein